MAVLTGIVLDILKPHEPGVLDFASQLADLNASYHVNLKVEEIDDRTHSIIVRITGENLHFDSIVERIEAMGGTVHSVDEVDVVGHKVKRS